MFKYFSLLFTTVFNLHLHHIFTILSLYFPTIITFLHVLSRCYIHYTHSLFGVYKCSLHYIYTVQTCAIHYKDSRWEWARWISTKALHKRECAGYTLYSVPGVVYTQFVFLWAGSMRIVWRGSQCWLEPR